MPEFQLNYSRRKHPYNRLGTFAQGYVEAMFFTNGDTGDERENLLNELGTARLTAKAVASIDADCEKFLALSMGAFTVREWLDDETSLRDYDEAQAGRDFWFTRQGHGVGFWDREQLTKEDGDKLSDLARKFGEAYVETWRGWIHHR